MFKVYIPLIKQGIHANGKNYLIILLLQETYICRIQSFLHIRVLSNKLDVFWSKNYCFHVLSLIADTIWES
jgi:hypothetical protein